MHKTPKDDQSLNWSMIFQGNATRILLEEKLVKLDN